MPGPEHKKKLDTTTRNNTQQNNAQTATDQSTSTTKDLEQNRQIEQSPEMLDLQLWKEQTEQSEMSKRKRG